MGSISSGREARRKNFFLPADLAGRVDSVARNLGLDFSELTRRAIREFVERAEKEALEKELAQACESYREFNKQFSDEWAHFETRIE